MAKKKLTTKEVADLRAAYEAWNPHDVNSISADELAAGFGISKQTMYNYRDRWIEQDRRDREKLVSARAPESGESSEAILFLTTELVRARARIDELERELEALRRHNSSPMSAAGM